MKFQRTTLCYISKGEDWLFIHKSRKNDQNVGKYLGIGGHIEKDETPDECIVREIFEETGLTGEEISGLKKYGDILFVSDIYGEEEMHVYLADYAAPEEKELQSCEEGELIWINKDRADELPVWEGDLIMFDLLRRKEQFKLRLEYEGDKLKKVDFLN